MKCTLLWPESSVSQTFWLVKKTNIYLIPLIIKAWHHLKCQDTSAKAIVVILILKLYFFDNFKDYQIFFFNFPSYCDPYNLSWDPSQPWL